MSIILNLNKTNTRIYVYLEWDCELAEEDINRRKKVMLFSVENMLVYE